MSGRPDGVLMQIEVAAARRGFGRTGVLGEGENERTFDGRYGCLGWLSMSTSQRVSVSAAEQDANTTRLLLTANKRRNEQVFDNLLVQELDATRLD